jgi:manganese/iron transport system substrate-binding protein
MHPHTPRLAIAVIAALSLLLTACGGSTAAPISTADTPTPAPTAAPRATPATVAHAPQPTAGAGKPTVIATTTQLEDVLMNVAGDRMTVIGLVPRNGDPHEFEPTPEDVKRIAESQAVFKNGIGLEGWLGELLANAGGERPIFDTSQGIQPGVIDRAFEEGGEEDPHIWMSPVLMQKVTDNVAAGLKQIDPAGAATYDANAAAYRGKLKELDAWAAQELAAIPPERRKLVTAHDAMGYFASRYNFTVIGALIPSVSTEAAETSAKDLAALVETIQAAGVPAIFAERSVNPTFIEQVAAEAHVKVLELYVDSLGEKGGEAGTYLDFMRTNVRRIVEGLK